jgi:hypothetical protein
MQQMWAASQSFSIGQTVVQDMQQMWAASQSFSVGQTVMQDMHAASQSFSFGQSSPSILKCTTHFKIDNDGL